MCELFVKHMLVYAVICSLPLHQFPCALIAVVLLRILDKIGIKRELRKRGTIAHYHQFFSGAGHSYIHAADIR